MSVLSLLRLMVFFWSDLWSRVLGSTFLRRGYHLWIAAVVIFGPLLQYYVNPRTIFANHRNFFNIKFVQSAWGWTCLLLGGFILLISYTASGSLLQTLRHLSRLAVGATIWFASGQLFLLIENVTGACFQPVPDGLLLLGHLQDKASCHREGHRWRGYDVSGHTFMLTYCCLTLAEEMAVFRRYLAARDAEADVPLRLVFLLNVTLLALWNFMLLCTVIYFHEYSHKIVGAALGTLCWSLTYRYWYRSHWSPGRPGHRLFVKAPEKPKLN